MSSEMIERVAARAYDAMGANGLLTFCEGCGYDGEPEHTKEIFRQIARSTIEEFREPTDAMLEVFDFNGNWDGAIDAALKSKEAQG